MLTAIQQFPAWAEFQAALANRQSFQIDGIFAYKLSIRKNLSFLYIPGIASWPQPEALSKLHQLAKKEGCAFIHIEPYFSKSENPSAPPPPGIKSPLHYIEPHTRYLNLELSEQDLLAQMKPKGRYNINLATKKGVTIKAEKNTTNFYQLFQQTTSRDGFSGYNQEFYDTMLTKLGPKHCQIFTAFHPHTNEPLASLVLTLHEQTATYYYGASSNEHRNLMAPYLLHWHAIQFAQKAGFKFYDFMGIAPPNSSSKHKLDGVSRFKAMFGGQTLQYETAHDIPLSWKYWAFWLYKKFR